MSEILNVNFPVCPVTCLLGLRLDNVCPAIYRLWHLCGLSVKRLILMNWKEWKKVCFSRDSWLGEFLDLLNIESAAKVLMDYDKGLDGAWNLLREYLTQHK